MKNVMNDVHEVEYELTLGRSVSITEEQEYYLHRKEIRRLEMQNNFKFQKTKRILIEEINKMKYLLTNKKGELEKLSRKYEIINSGNFYMYVAQMDRVNKMIEGKNIAEMFNPVMESFFIDVQVNPKESMGVGSFEYFVNSEGDIKYIRAKMDSSD
jgi:hypothetical protein